MPRLPTSSAILHPTTQKKTFNAAEIFKYMKPELKVPIGDETRSDGLYTFQILFRDIKANHVTCVENSPNVIDASAPTKKQAGMRSLGSRAAHSASSLRGPLQSEARLPPASRTRQILRTTNNLDWAKLALNKRIFPKNYKWAKSQPKTVRGGSRCPFVF